MATTFATATPITPARRPSFGRFKPVPEHSAQTFPRGAPAQISAGYLSVVTGDLPLVIAGFTRKAGQDGAADGAKKGALYLALPGVTFNGTLRDTLAESQRYAKALISVNSAGACFLTIATASSASYNCRIEGWTSKYKVGDVNPVVIFTLLNSVIQGVN